MAANLSTIVADIKAAEVAAPGYCDWLAAKVKAQEGNVVSNFILTHLGFTDPTTAEEKFISLMATIKALATEEPKYVDPFLNMLVGLIQPAAGA